ncbi:unnamed protein product [Pedinophyceae sp. YPF-701]|nr:unnamed protein product [Pedinophyceae sp. YPF-701]
MARRTVHPRTSREDPAGSAEEAATETQACLDGIGPRSGPPAAETAVRRKHRGQPSRAAALCRQIIVWALMVSWTGVTLVLLEGNAFGYRKIPRVGLATSRPFTIPEYAWPREPLAVPPRPDEDAARLKFALAAKAKACRSLGMVWDPAGRVCQGLSNTFNYCGKRKVVAITVDAAALSVLEAPDHDEGDTTFDVAPVDAILGDLSAANITATFFIAPGAGLKPDVPAGRFMVPYEDMLQLRCDTLRRIAQHGHEIQQATFTGKALVSWGGDHQGQHAQPTAIITGAAQAAEWLADCTGAGLPRATMLRPPAMDVTADQASVVNDVGYATAAYLIESTDWAVADLSDEDLKREKILNRILYGRDATTGEPLSPKTHPSLVPIVRKRSSAVIALSESHYVRGVIPELVRLVKNIDPEYRFVGASDCYHACSDFACVDEESGWPCSQYDWC